MKVTPFFVPGNNQQNTPMGIDYHLVPGVHALFFGPVECARHSFPQLVDDPDGSLLVVNDVQASLGSTEELVREAVGEISAADPNVRAFMLCTACQTAFMGIDLEGLCLDLHAETGLCFGHVEANRMAAENIPGRARKDIAGGDRYHSRLALFRMLRQAEAPASAGGKDGGNAGSGEPSGGVLFLTGDALNPGNEVLQIAGLPGVGWVRGVGDCASFEDFLQLRHARLTIATSMSWKEVGEWMRDTFGIPTLYLPTSYALEEVDGYYEELERALGELLEAREDAGAEEALRRFSEACAEKRAQAERLVAETAAACPAVDLDARLVNRPFSLYEALLSYGFHVRDFLPSAMRVQHKEADDIDAFERLCARIPYLRARFAERPNSTKRARRGTRTKNLRRAGRWVSVAGEYRAPRVPEETAWWGYESVCEMMRQIGRGLRGTQGSQGALGQHGPQGAQGAGGQRDVQRGRWAL